MGEILIVGFIGVFCNAIVFLLPGLQTPFRQALANKEFALIVTIIFLLLTWPTGAGETYGQGEALGVARLVRVFAFLVIFAFLVLKNPPFPSGRETALVGFMGYVAICFISSLYAPSMLETIWKSFELLVLLLFALRTRMLFSQGRLAFSNIVAIFFVSDVSTRGTDLRI